MNYRVTMTSLILAASTVPAMAQDIVARIGVAAPLTGAIAHLGKDMENGARLAIDDLNAQGLVIGGHRTKFVAVVEDDRGDPAAATAVAQKFADMNLNGVVGHLSSGTTIPAARVYNEAGLPQVAPAATNPQYTQAGYKFAVRLMATDLQQGDGIASFVSKTLGARTVALIDDRTAYGQGLADQVNAKLAPTSSKVLRREFTSDRATDVSAILTSIGALKPDVIVFAGADAQGAQINRQMKQLGIASKFVAGDGVCTGEWTKLSAGTNEGAYCSQAGAARESMKGLDAFNRRYKARFNSEVVIFAPYAYDSVMLLAAAMKHANSIDPAVFGPALKSTEFSGLIGPVKFDARGDNLNGVVTMYQVREGELASLPARTP